MSNRQVKKTEAGQEYQIELLSKEYARLRKSLTKQISLFDDLIKTANGDTATVKQELVILGETYAELSSNSTRLCEVVSEDKATQIKDTVTMEGERVERIDKATREWLTAQELMESTYRSQGQSLDTGSQSKGKEEATDNMALTVQLMKKTF